MVKSVRSGTHEQSSRWRHRPSHPYPLPWAVGEQQRGNPRKKEAATATKLPALASFEYFDRRVTRGQQILPLISCLFITLYSCTFPLRHPEKRLFTPRPPTNPSLSCLDLSAPHQCTQCTRSLLREGPGCHGIRCHAANVRARTLRTSSRRSNQLLRRRRTPDGSTCPCTKP